MDAGLNLYSIRNQIQSESEFLAAAQRIKDMGYAHIQYSGTAFDIKRIKKMQESVGLPVVLTHVPMDRILQDTEALIDEHEAIGCRNIGLGMMPIDVIADETVCKRTIEDLNTAAEKIARRGMKFFYHHHHFEFARYGSQTVFDYILETAPHINFTLDVYWLQYGGVSILEYIDKCRGRIECVHLKDYRIHFADNKKFEPIFAAVGDGNIRFDAYLDALSAAGVKYYIVEQDNATSCDDPFGEVKRSIDYIKTNF